MDAGDASPEPQVASRADALRPAWRWGMWIGLTLLLVGIASIVLGLKVAVPSNFSEAMRVQTPAAIAVAAKSGVSLAAQGIVAFIVGGGMAAVSGFKLRARGKKPEDPSGWSS